MIMLQGRVVARICILKETWDRGRDGEPVPRGQTKLEEMRGQKQMSRDSHEWTRKQLGVREVGGIENVTGV